VKQSAEQRARGGKMEKGELGPATRVLIWRCETGGWWQAVAAAMV
jgi:hypothetical protein